MGGSTAGVFSAGNVYNGVVCVQRGGDSGKAGGRGDRIEPKNPEEPLSCSTGRLSRNVWVAGLVSLFTGISSEMLIPILPVFLSTVPGAPAAAIGVFNALTGLAAGLPWDRVSPAAPFRVGSATAVLSAGLPAFWA